MKRYLLALAGMLLTGNLLNAAPPVSTTAFDPATTYVFMSGVLKWQSLSLSSFSNRNRKDEELYNLLLSNGVKKENTVFLKDNEATLENMKSNLKALLQKTSASSTFIFYYAGHGVRGGNGPVCFANYDYDGAKANGFQATIVAELVNSLFKGKQVWLLADCCFSGSLLDEAKKIGSTGKSVISFTSSSSSNISTGNWTFTQTMIDCFGGSTFSDRNNDKKVSLAETKSELFDAMKYREKQLSGTVFYNADETTVMNLSAVPVGPKPVPAQYIYVQQDQKFEPARVIHSTSQQVSGELYHYSDKMIVTVALSVTKPIAFAEYPVGMKVQVEWSGKNYPAVIKETRSGFHYIHYTGYDDSWNEWVMYDRITTSDRKKCSIEWKGTWYPGEMLQQKDSKYFVHYTGFGNDWDEWVGAERVKL